MRPRAVRVLIAVLCFGLGTPALSDPANLLVIEETDAPHFSILDGDTFDVFARIETSFDLQSAPVFSPDGRTVFRLSQDGWVQKIDLLRGAETARIRAGLSSSDIALSHDGKWLAVANQTPNTLTILSADDLSVAEVHQIADKHRTPSGVAAVITRPTLESFVLTLSDVREVWEVFYGPNPPFYGFVHDYRIEGPPDETEAFPMRRITVPDLLGDFRLDPSFEYVMAAKQGRAGGTVIDLVIGQTVADLNVSDLTSAVTWQQGDRSFMAVPHLTQNTLSVIDLKSWETVAQITTNEPDTVLRTHDKLSTIWAVSGDVVNLIDKHSLETRRTLRPMPDAQISELRFNRDGTHALIAFEGGGVVVLNTQTFAQIKHLATGKSAQIYRIAP